MEITVKIATESGTFEMTGDSSDQFDCWQVDQNYAGREAADVSDIIAEAIFKHFNK